MRLYGGNTVAIALDSARLHEERAQVAAVLTGDRRPVPETMAWIADLMSTRGITRRWSTNCRSGQSAHSATIHWRAIVDTAFTDDR